MIEKLKARNRDDGFLEPATPSDIHWKINELVDAVNELQATLDACTKRFRELDDESMQKITKITQNSTNNVKNSHLFQGNEQKDHKICSTNERLRKALEIALDMLVQMDRKIKLTTEPITKGKENANR